MPSAINGSITRTIAQSHYNALQTTLKKRVSHGLEFQASYTWSHAIDNAADPIDAVSGNRPFPRNSLDLGPEAGNSPTRLGSERDQSGRAAARPGPRRLQYPRSS